MKVLASKTTILQLLKFKKKSLQGIKNVIVSNLLLLNWKKWFGLDVNEDITFTT